jgi:outer membrane protein assembly factor BamE (lipoprotein component of BamABCDE complex)
MGRYGSVVLFFLCFSCSSIRHNGSQFIVNREKVDNFDVYNQTREDLVGNFGYPTAELEFGTWLYYYYRVKTNTILPTRIEKEAVLLVYFDKNGRIISHLFREMDGPGKLANIEIERDDGNKNERRSLMREILEGLDIAPAM